MFSRSIRRLRLMFANSFCVFHQLVNLNRPLALCMGCFRKIVILEATDIGLLYETRICRWQSQSLSIFLGENRDEARA